MGKMAKEEKVIIKDFQKISKQMEPKPKYFKNILMAFLVGGAICTLGQFILNMLIKFGIEEETAKDSGSQRQSETDTHTLPDAVVFLRTEVLPDKGSHRDAVSTQDHPEETVNLTECGPCSDCIGAKRVDRRLDNHIGDCVHI